MTSFSLISNKNENNGSYSITSIDKTTSVDIIESEHEIILNLSDVNIVNIKVNKGVKVEGILRLENIKDNLCINVLVDEMAYLKQHLVRLNTNNDINLKVNVNIKQNGHYDCIISEFSASNVIYNLDVNLNEVEASSYVRLASVAAKEEDKKFYVNITSNAQYTNGKMDNYGVVKEKGKMLIEGIGKIINGANGANSDQNNKIIIFDQTSTAIARPLLYIDEYDVKASHASGVGKIDDDQIYYLNTRGLNDNQARRFITLGYLTPVLNYLDNEHLKDEIYDALIKKVD